MPDTRRFTLRTFWTVSLAAAVVLVAIVAIPQWLSKQARLEVLRSNVGSIARLAASVVDGDLHRQLLDPANKTPELYSRTLEPLVRFHAAYPEIFYVYTMVDRGGQSYFVVDTAAESDKLESPHKLVPSEYMEPFNTLDAEPDPDWLQRIAAGQTYVYPSFQRDKYGTFLSGHAPIYDSQGRYSGFVGVDFDLAYYLAQEASFRAISIGTLTGAVLLALLIGYVAARYHYDLNDRIEQQYRASIRDELTSLLNRRGALTAVSEALAVQASTYATILVDVDDLKGINDNYGHVTGDQLLISVAEAIRESVRHSDICARFGGDEFLIFAAGCDLDAATEIARRILSKVHAKRQALENARFGVSIGIDVAPLSEAAFEAMYRRADQALYQAKGTGRNRYVISDVRQASA
ncbi:MAG TPA: GGDEF domain-containing protein [Steroidobacteraceae bacterium]|nr:GGDEF domain-containing protein [Steroidobacteraceae bacterium]